MAKKSNTKILSGSKYDLEVQYQDYLNMLGIPESMMHPVQKKQTKNAFYAGALMLYQLLVHDINDLSEAEAVQKLDNLYDQMKGHFEREVARGGEK